MYESQKPKVLFTYFEYENVRSFLESIFESNLDEMEIDQKNNVAMAFPFTKFMTNKYIIGADEELLRIFYDNNKDVINNLLNNKTFEEFKSVVDKEGSEYVINEIYKC